MRPWANGRLRDWGQHKCPLGGPCRGQTRPRARGTWGTPSPPSKRCTGLSVTVPRRGRRLTEQPPGPRRTAGSPTGQAPACRGRRPRGLGREDRINPCGSMRVTCRVAEEGPGRFRNSECRGFFCQTPGCHSSCEHSLTHERGAVGGGHTRQRDPLPCGACPAP